MTAAPTDSVSATPPTGEDWSDPTPEQIAACAAYDPEPEQYGTAALATRTADDVFERPPWCGTCDEWTRKVEVEVDGRDAMQNCTRCHPLAAAS